MRWMNFSLPLGALALLRQGSCEGALPASPAVLDIAPDRPGMHELETLLHVCSLRRWRGWLRSQLQLAQIPLAGVLEQLRQPFLNKPAPLVKLLDVLNDRRGDLVPLGRLSCQRVCQKILPPGPPMHLLLEGCLR